MPSPHALRWVYADALRALNGRQERPAPHGTHTRLEAGRDASVVLRHYAAPVATWRPDGTVVLCPQRFSPTTLRRVSDYTAARPWTAECGALFDRSGLISHGSEEESDSEAAARMAVRFKTGRLAVPIGPSAALARLQACAAAKGEGPVPMPAHWVGFDHAAVPQPQPALICLECAATFRSESDQDAHARQKRGAHEGRWLHKSPPEGMEAWP